MKRIKAFGRFWAKFIIGDDWAIGVAVLWCVTLLHGMASRFINAWYLLPVAMAGVLGISVWNVYRQSFGSDETTPHLAGLWAPAIAVTLLPIVIFRFTSDDATFAHLYFPVAVYLVVVMALVIILRSYYLKNPFAASVIAMLGVVFILHVADGKLVNTAERLGSAIPGGVFALIILGITVVGLALGGVASGMVMPVAKQKS